MSAVYNNLVASFLMPGRNTSGARDVHKKNELRAHYNDIVNLNSRLPLYIIRLDDDRQEYVLNLKEQSLLLSDDIDKFREESAKAFTHKSAWAGNSSVNARIVSDDYDNLPDEFEIEVNHLATTQCNAGGAFYPDGKGLSGGDYLFQARVGDSTYEFKYTIANGVKNEAFMNNLTSYINKSDIGINASVGITQDKKIYMKFESVETGDYGESIFSFEDKDIDENSKGIVSFYGINNVVRNAASSEFLLDGDIRHTLSNRFVLNNSLEVTLNSTTECPIRVGYSMDGREAFELVDNMFSTYNNIIDFAHDYEKRSGEHTRLNNELSILVKKDISQLESVGVEYDDEGHLNLNRDIASQAFSTDEFQEAFSPYGHFINKLDGKCRALSLNPMEYIKKLMVTYPDYSKHVNTSSYISSVYSGMLFNYYC